MTELPPPVPAAPPAPAAPARLTFIRRAVLYATPLLLLGIAFGGGLAAWPQLSAYPAGPYSKSGLAMRTSLPDAVDEHPDGDKLYQFHCATCHGATGDGVGLAGLNPRARYFGYDKFKFVSTTNAAKTGGGMPTDDDLYGTLHRGIAGSPMPAFGHLPEPQLRALVDRVKRFVRVGVIVERLKDMAKAKAEAGDEGFDEKVDWSDAAVERMRQMAEKEAAAGSAFERPSPFPPSTADSIARGRLVFEKAACVSCHGSDGKGDGPQSKDPKFLNENGTKAVPRDLTAGLFKGGEAAEHIYARIYLGIPGTPMPMSGAAVSAPDIVSLVHYVKSLERK